MIDPDQMAALAREAQERMEVLESKGLTPEMITKMNEAAARMDEYVDRLRARGLTLEQIVEISDQTSALQPIVIDDGPSLSEISAKIDALAERIDRIETRLG